MQNSIKINVDENYTKVECDRSISNLSNGTLREFDSL